MTDHSVTAQELQAIAQELQLTRSQLQAVSAQVNEISLTLEALETQDSSRPVFRACLLYTSPSPRDLSTSRMPSSA